MLNAPSTQTTDTWDRFLAQGLLGSRRLLQNADISISAVSLGDETVPLITNRSGRADCSWVTSLKNAYGPYARAETDIVKMSPFLQPLYLAGSHFAESVLSLGGLAGGNFLNNWLLATNLYKEELTADSIYIAARTISQRDPDLPVVVRSLTPPLHGKLIEELSARGFILLPSRQVWIVHDPASGEWRSRRDARRDLALSASTTKQWHWIPAADFSARDYTKALELYQNLYRKRYPIYNPDYTEDFFRIGVQTGFLDLWGLRAAGETSLCGLVGMAHREAVSCTPVLGYETEAPVSLGLYRLLMLRAFLECEQRKTKLHCSAGAGLFKFNRGAESHVEFAAVWANHLPFYRRANLRALAASVRKWIVPYLESHQL